MGALGPGAAVNFGHLSIRFLSSGNEIRLWGDSSKTRRRILSSSEEMGRIEVRNLGSCVKALKVGSLVQAFFHGLRPQARFTRITPRLQMSLRAAS